MAEALVGGAFLSAFLQVLFDRMASRKFLDFFRGQKLSEEHLRKLKIALLSVNAVLEDAEEKELTNPTVKEWLDELKDAVYDAEDILDEIATQALQGTKVQTDVKKAIKHVLGSLEFLAKQKDVIGLREGVGVRPSQRLPTTSFVEKSATFGRDDDKEAVINSLLSDDASGNENENVRVIAIVGMGGIGKTTLAQLVYNDTRVKDHFKLEAWICVSYEFDVLKVTKTILEAVTSRTWDIEDLDLLQKKLRQKLKGKKFLFVLDDVWNEIYACWELLSNAFQSGAPGSTVIVTTRNEKVASTMRNIATHHLKKLPKKDCWALFAKHAFGGGKSDSYPELEEIGKQIVKKCKGLPLAAKAIGALLWSKQDADEWDQVLKSELWDLPNDGRNILPALRLSYKYLPSHLKRCFAYCSIFPKVHIFKKDELVLLWMAEGFLLESINKTIEEVGDEYFCDLVSRSLFQQLSGDGSSFVMHHLVNDLAIFVSGQLSFRLEGDYSSQIEYKTRHLSYLRTRFDENFEAPCKAEQLRTFLLLPSSCSDVDSIGKVLPNLLSRLTCLRVLSFSQCINITKLSDSIGKIIHLRYLDLSSTRIESLPDSICELCNLQTLKLSGCVALVELPGDLQKLFNLRHLDLSSTLLQCLPDSICNLSNLQTLNVSNCRNLIALPREIEKLTNLRYLDLSSTAVKGLSDSICELLNLQTLKCCVGLVELPRNVCKLINLRHLDLSLNGLLQWLPDSICELCNLQTLKLSDCINLSALPREIKKLTNLRHLDISGTGIREMPTQLSRLKRLQMLTTFIVGKDRGSPIQELGKLVNLRGKLSILELQNAKISTVEAVLKYMNNLEELVLEWNDPNTSSSESQRNEKLVFDSLKPRTNLKSLVIKYYGGECFPDWVGDPSYSNIASLRLENCKYCCTLPPLGQLPSLKNLAIVGFEGVVKVDHEFYGNGSSSFGALKVLRFENLLKWVEWSSFGAEKEGQAFPQLEELYIVECPNLSKGMPARLTRLAKLEINECMQLVGPLSSARTGCEMRLTRCNEALLKDLPSGIRLFVVAGFNKLVSFPKEIMDSSSRLQELRIYNCSSLMYLSGGGLPSTLKSLKVEFCEKLELPMQLNCLFLEKLHLTNSCDFLRSFQLEVFPKLYEIKIHGCKNLESLTVLHEDNLVIVQIEIRNCPNFVSFPNGGLRAPNLTNFSVANCGSLKSLPDKMHIFLPSLKDLRIKDCPEIDSLPRGGLPSKLNLDSIHIEGCEKLVAHLNGMRFPNIFDLFQI